MRAGVFRGVHTIEVEEMDKPSTGPQGIVINVKACGICGSDLHSFHQGAFVENGQIMGHEFSGEVVEVGSDVEGIQVGDRVTALPLTDCGICPRCIEGNPHLCETGLAASIAYGLPGAFAEFLHIPRAILGKTVFLLPDEVSYEEGAMVESFSVGLHAVRLAVPEPTDTAVVIGLGAIGQSVVQSLKAMGVGNIIGVDISQLRLEKAEVSGANVVIDASATDPLDEVRELLGEGAYGVGSRADLVFECSGATLMLQEAIQMVRAGGKLLITALFDGNVPIDATMIVQKELNVQGTFGYKGEFSKSIELMRAKRVNVEQLITHRFPLDQIQQAFELPGSHSLKVLITP